MPSLPHEQHSAHSPEDLMAALAELNMTVGQLRQQNGDLTTHYQAVVESHERHQAIGRLARRLRQSLQRAEILSQAVSTVRELLSRSSSYLSSQGRWNRQGD
ncbi:MAG: hypothetical protein HC772_04200 [Leptolyngbyaceae cyanobacterium CRU_2_3]|nr:hypothetical protein [Leptolyngbyaceae cyanobacterium CRU_2_3]